MSWMWLMLAFGWGDADRRAIERLRADGLLDEGREAQGWFLVGPPIEGFEVVRVLSRVSVTGEGDGIEPGVWEQPIVCFGGPADVWCGADRLRGAVAAFDLAQEGAPLPDFEWVRLIVLAADEPCGWPVDLEAADPRVPGRMLDWAPEPEVVRSPGGGVVVTVGCVVDHAVARRTVTVGADGSVAVAMEAVSEAPDPEGSAEEPDQGLRPVRGALRRR